MYGFSVKIPSFIKLKLKEKTHFRKCNSLDIQCINENKITIAD